MIRYRFTIVCIFSMFLVVSSTMTLQNVSALAPEATITQSSVSNGGTVQIASGETTRVTFQYQGIDDNDHIQYLECKWDTEPFTRTNCSTGPEERMTLTGEDGRSRLYWVRTGSAFKDLGPGSLTHTFTVRVRSDSYDESIPWRFTITAPMQTPITPAMPPTTPAMPPITPALSPTAPSIRITRIIDPTGFIVSESFPSDNGDVIILTEGHGDGLSRRCFSFGNTPIPRSPSIPTTPFSPATGAGCTANIFDPHPISISGSDVGSGNLAGGINYGQFYVCVAVWNQNNMRSAPSCSSFNVAPLPENPPLTRIQFHRPNTGTAYQNLQDGQTTQYRNIHFIFGAYPLPGRDFDPTKAALFECDWDQQGWRPCGQTPIFSAILCIPSSGGISNCPQNVRLSVVPYLGKDIVQGISEGRHSVEVRSKYPFSQPSIRGSEGTFEWCVVSCAATSNFRPIMVPGPYSGSPSMVTDTNQSSIPIVLANAGLDKTVYKNTNVVLGGNLYVIPPANFPNNGTISDLKNILAPDLGIKSISWKQISGQEVKLNSTNTMAVKFEAPDLKDNQLLKFNFTMTDNNGVEHSDTVDVGVNTTNSTVGQIGIIPRNQTSSTEGEQADDVAVRVKPESTTAEGGESGAGVQGSNVPPDLTPAQEEEQRVPAGAGADDDASASKIEKGDSPLQDSKTSCPAGETYIPNEGCAPS